MHHWSVRDVADYDVVMIEVHVLRSQCDEDGNIVTDGNWDRYRVHLELQTVCMIWRNPTL